MTPEDIAAAIEPVITARLEEVYGELEALKQEVREAVSALAATAQVLHDNDVAVMAKMAEVQGDQTAGYAARVQESWARFVRAEAEQLGWRVLVPKVGGGSDDG